MKRAAAPVLLNECAKNPPTLASARYELPRPCPGHSSTGEHREEVRNRQIDIVPARCDDVPRLAPDIPGPWIPGAITIHTQVQIYREAHDASNPGVPFWPHPLSKPHSVCLSFSPSAFRRHDTLLENNPIRGRASSNQVTQTSPSFTIFPTKSQHTQPQCSSQLAQP